MSNMYDISPFFYFFVNFLFGKVGCDRLSRSFTALSPSGSTNMLLCVMQKLPNKNARRWHARVCVTWRAAAAVLFALHVLLPVVLSTRQLRDVQSQEGEMELRYVSTSQSFIDAVGAGVRHVVVTEHLDLSQFSRKLPTLTRGVIAPAETVSIQVRCNFPLHDAF
jgi:hypothetical protein